MKQLTALLAVICILTLIACGDTTTPEPAAVSDSASAADLNATATASAQAKSAAQPAPTPTSVSTATHTPTPTPTADSYYNLALDNLAEDGFDSAIDNLNKAIELNPEHADAYHERGRAYTYKNDYDKAIADFDRALELDPNDMDTEVLRAGAYALRGVAYYEAGDYDSAIADFNGVIADLDKIIELDPNNADANILVANAYLVRGVAYYEEGDYDKAIADYEEAIADFERISELDPNNADVDVLVAGAYLVRGIAYHEKGDYDSAIADHDKAIELYPNYADAYYERGRAYIYKEDLDRSIADFNKAIDLNPEHADAYYERGFSHYSQEDDDAAIADFDKAIELNPEHADAHYLRGELHYFKDDYDSAIADFSKAIELNSEYAANAYYFRGEAHYFQGDDDAAIADFNKAIELIPNDTDFKAEAAYAYLLRGIGYAEEGDRDKAIADYHKAVELDPDNPGIKKARKFIDRPLASDELSAERIKWSLCEGFLECGFIEVPADYRNPDAGSIEIAVNVRRADHQDERIGYMLVNPGGPGGSGLELVQYSEFSFADDLLERFDIIGFDPRGVGASEPSFACGAPGERIALLKSIDGDIDTPDEIAAGEAAANLCIESMGAIGALLHSEYVARDMDEIRKALGAQQISYLGYSYGSALGVWYATLFPESVRAMVLDGADNPVDQADTQQERMEQALEELAPFEEQLQQALTACDSARCPIYNAGAPISYYYRAAENLHLVNSAVGGVPYAAFLGVVTPLYNEAQWPDLWQSLYELHENDDPTILLEFVRRQLDEDPTAANFTAHVNCLDDFMLKPELDRATRLDDSVVIDAASAEKFPLIEAADTNFPSACPFYDQFAPPPLDIPLDGGDVPILVIGNHADPATPFDESEELVTQTLSNGYLLETSHPRHTVYPDNKCVNHHVHNALIDLVYPNNRASCPRED